MAKQKGFIKLKGSLGGLTFYDDNGQSLVRTTGGVDKNKIINDPAFKRTRENMAEFGGAAKVGKSLRMGFVSVINSMSGRYVTARLTGVMKRLNSVGSGLRGQRAFEILNNKVLLEGFEFNDKEVLDAVFFATYDSPSLDANRNVATWVIHDFNTDNYIVAPEGASHFRVLLATTVLSDFAYDTSLKSYEPVNADENEVSGIALSNAIVLGGMVGSDINLSIDLGFASALPATVGVVSAIGIIFYQEINGQLYELASDNAMRIEVVG